MYYTAKTNQTTITVFVASVVCGILHFMNIVYRFFDVLEDKVRAWLSKWPIFYAMLAGIGAVLFFRGIWHFADEVGLNSFFSLAISLVIMLITGSFVSHFVTNEVILSGLRKEKKVIDKTESEILSEMITLIDIKEDLGKIRDDIEELKGRIKK